MYSWEEKLIFGFVALLVLGLLSLIPLMIWGTSAQYTEFMEECTKHEMKYECTAKWRAGDYHHR